MFALYSAWYFWAPKIIGLFYNQRLSKVHFWILFVGVNLTFFPQHFLGLQGMPRRISDYADAFAGWNMVSSLGSIVSVIATYVFLHLVYLQLRGDLFVIRNPWTLSGFYTDTLRVINSRVSTSLEWVLTNPPKPHAFISLPLQSNISSWFSKNNLKNFIIRGLIIFFTGLALRLLVLNVLGVNVFLQPFETLSLIYYGAMAMFTVIQYELYPMEVAMQPSTGMVQEISTKNSGVLAMDNANNTTGNNGPNWNNPVATSTRGANAPSTRTPTSITDSSTNTDTTTTAEPITGNLTSASTYHVDGTLYVRFTDDNGQSVTIKGNQLHRALNAADANGLNIAAQLAYNQAEPFVEPFDENPGENNNGTENNQEANNGNGTENNQEADNGNGTGNNH